MAGAAKVNARQMFELARLVGLPAAVEYCARATAGTSGVVKARCRFGRFEIRVGESDHLVALQTFSRQDYKLDAARTERLNALARRLRAAGRTPLIVDAGTNVGYSAMFLASIYPEAAIVAVEPDLHAFVQARRHCADLPQVKVVHGALWRHGGGVHLERTGEASWARQVADGGATPSFTLKDLLAMTPDAAPLILKMDVPGAVRDVCGEAAEELSKFSCILVEPQDSFMPGTGTLHGLHGALARRRMDTLVNGESLIFYDSSLAAGAAA